MSSLKSCVLQPPSHAEGTGVRAIFPTPLCLSCRVLTPHPRSRSFPGTRDGSLAVPPGFEFRGLIAHACSLLPIDCQFIRSLTTTDCLVIFPDLPLFDSFDCSFGYLPVASPPGNQPALHSAAAEPRPPPDPAGHRDAPSSVFPPRHRDP